MYEEESENMKKHQRLMFCYHICNSLFIFKTKKNDFICAVTTHQVSDQEKEGQMKGFFNPRGRMLLLHPVDDKDPFLWSV